MWGWIAAIIISILLILLAKAVSSLVQKINKEKVRDLNTPLNVYSGSSVLDKMFTTNKAPEESIAMQYERMCILDPRTYKGDPSIPDLIDQYRKIIKGKTLDPKAENIPSERILGELNPDYQTYLAAQRKALALAGYNTVWFDQEWKRVSKVSKIETINQKFTQKLIEFGMPIEMVPFAYSDTRIENWVAADWKKLIKLIKDESELGDVSQEALGAFILHNEDKEILFSRAKLEAFNLYFQENVPIPLISMYIQNKITEENMYDIINLVQEDEWSEAIKDVLKEDMDRDEEFDLREAYQLSVQKGIMFKN
jgi:hypothetical protein